MNMFTAWNKNSWSLYIYIYLTHFSQGLRSCLVYCSDLFSATDEKQIWPEVGLCTPLNCLINGHMI